LKFDFVVSHFRENIKWIEGLKGESIGRIFVYTKGDRFPDVDNEKIVHFYLPNVGRESHTYIWHFVNNFEPDRSDFTFFLQGSPHGMNPRSILEWARACEDFNLDFTLNYRISSPYDFLSAGRIRSWAGETRPAECDVRCWCDKYVKEGASMKDIPIFWNACFGVSSRCLAGADRSKLIAIQQKELSDLNPECGHFCERLWFYMFGIDLVYDGTLPDGFWHFWGGHDGSRHHGIMRLMEDGSVGLYNNHNERKWEREGESIILLDGNGRKTCVMDRVSDEEYSGRFLGSSNSIHKISRRHEIEK